MHLIAIMGEGGVGAVLLYLLAIIGLLAVLCSLAFVALVWWGDRQHPAPRRERLGWLARRRTRKAIERLEFLDHPSHGGGRR